MQTINHFAVVNAVAQALASTQLGKERTKALKAIRWVFATEDGKFACLDGLNCALTESIDVAQVFDGRDNESLKARFWEKQLGTKLIASLL